MISNLPSWSDYGTHDESRFPELWQGCVGAWAPCLGPTGLKLFDLSTADNFGTLTNMDAPTDWVISSGLYALDFDAVNDFVSTDLNLTGQFGVSLWFNRRSVGTFSERVLWGNTANSNTYMGLITPTSVNVQGNTAAQAKTFSGFTISNGIWYHVAINRDTSNSVRVWLNGVESSSGAQSVIGTFTLNAIARYSTGTGGNAPFNWDGLIDDVRVYSKPIAFDDLKTLSLGRGVSFQRRRKKSFYTVQAGFNPAWARSSNYIISPVGAA